MTRHGFCFVFTGVLGVDLYDSNEPRHIFQSDLSLALQILTLMHCKHFIKKFSFPLMEIHSPLF